MLITAEEVRRLLDYDPASGLLTWKVQRGRARAGDAAGCISRLENGYAWIQVRLLGKLYPAHRIAWLHYHGAFPAGQLDHKNQDSTDNRIDNLRDTIQSVNSKNQHMKTTNTSGVTGVYWEERTKKWRASVKVNGQTNRLGRFENIHDAAEAVLAFRKCTGFTEIHGAAKRLQEA